MYRALRQHALFDGLHNDDLINAITSGDLMVETFWRDDLIADGQSLDRMGSRIHLVKTGQVAVAVFPRDVLDAERAWQADTSPDERRKKVRSQGPLIRLAEKNVASFGEGDLFNSEAIAAVDIERTAFYAVEPTELIVVTTERMGQLTRKFGFFAQRLRRAIEISRGRLGGITGVKQEVFDFYVRNGLSVAETLRVRQIDRCIECKECEKACEERYGHKRLSIFGPSLGMLDFIFTCRTCKDQRCIDPCNYDSIRFDEKKKEVVINETTCTGCAACAVGCPYGAIEMVDIEDPDKKGLKLRLQASGALGFGDGKGRKARLEKIASKCDHCATYTDQACVARCPTGALIEIKPTDIFKDRREVAKAAARTGFDQTMHINVKDMMAADPFKKGLGITDFADAKVKRGRASPYLIWGLGLLALFVSIAEVVLRKWLPSLSAQYYILKAEGLEASVALAKVGYSPGCDLAVWFGYIGTGLMLVSMLYPLRKRSRTLQKIATSASWFDFHLMGGVVGAAFVTMHSVLKLDNWVSMAFWSMALVIVSGLMGRYLYVQVPEFLHGAELEELEHQRALAKHRAKHPNAVRHVDDEAAAYKADAEAAARGALPSVLVWAFVDELKRPVRWLARRRLLAENGVPRAMRADLVRHASAIMLVDRRRVLIPRMQTILLTWRQIHVPFTFVMTVITIAHIAVALSYSM